MFKKSLIAIFTASVLSLLIVGWVSMFKSLNLHEDAVISVCVLTLVGCIWSVLGESSF